MILALAFKALHSWGALRFGLLNGCGPNLCFPKALGEVPDFHGKNPATSHLTFATEIRNRFALGDMDCDNHIGRACSLPSAGDRSNIILGVPRSNHKEQGRFRDNIIK